MPIYNNPALGQSLENIAGLFAPPSAQDAAAYSTAGLNNQKKNLIADTYGYINGDNVDLNKVDRLMGLVNGGYAPTQGFGARDMTDATNRYKIDQDNATELKKALLAPVQQDAARFVPPDIASTFDISQTQAGPRSPLSETEWQAQQNQRLLDTGKLTDQNLVDMGLGKNNPVEAVGPDGKPIYMNPGEAVRTGAQVAPRQPSTVIDMGGNAYQRAIGENLAKDYISYQNDARNGVQTLTTLGAMKNMLDDPSFYSGFGAQPLLQVKQLVASLGLDPSAAASMENFNAFGKKAALDAIGTLGTGVSEGDRQSVEQQNPNLNASPAGNRALIDMLGKLAQRKIDIAKFADEYARAHPDANGNPQLDQSFTSALAEWANAHPLFPPVPAAPAAGAAGAAGAAPEATIVTSQDGRKMVKRNGQWEPVT